MIIYSNRFFFQGYSYNNATTLVTLREKECKKLKHKVKILILTEYNNWRFMIFFTHCFDRLIYVVAKTIAFPNI